MDKKQTIKVNVAKSSPCYTGVSSPKAKQISKAKDCLQALERRIKLRDKGNIEEQLYEGMTIQRRLRSYKEGITISLKLKNLMRKRNVNGALKLLTDNMHSEILPLTKEALELLVEKDSEPRGPTSEPTRIYNTYSYNTT